MSTLEHKEVEKLMEHAETRSVWSFSEALGDTIMEKYESLYVKMVELTTMLINKGASGYFWLATSKEIAAIFETATAGFAPTPARDRPLCEHVPMGKNALPCALPYEHEEVYCTGIINKKWRIYVDVNITNQILIGCNFKDIDSKHCGVMRVIGVV